MNKQKFIHDLMILQSKMLPVHAPMIDASCHNPVVCNCSKLLTETSLLVTYLLIMIVDIYETLSNYMTKIFMETTVETYK